MSGKISNHGAANLLKNESDTVEIQCGRMEGWKKQTKRLLNVLGIGLMSVCNAAFASEPASSSQSNPASAAVGDSIFDWTIVFFAILLILFFSIQFWDSRKNDEK